MAKTTSDFEIISKCVGWKGLFFIFYVLQGSSGTREEYRLLFEVSSVKITSMNDVCYPFYIPTQLLGNKIKLQV